MSTASLTETVGTPYYVAPEVIMSSYSTECDIWSIGVLMYIMLSGYLPFTGSSPNEVFVKILKGQLSFDQPEWKSMSFESKDLLKKLLVVNHTERIKAEAALSHDWFKIDDDTLMY